MFGDGSIIVLEGLVNKFMLLRIQAVYFGCQVKKQRKDGCQRIILNLLITFKSMLCLVPPLRVVSLEKYSITLYFYSHIIFLFYTCVTYS